MSGKNAPTVVCQPDRVAVFQEQAIRRTWHEDQWWFSVVDVCRVLTDSADGGAYWRKLKQRLGAEGREPVTFCHGLKLQAPDGKQRITDCANTEGLFRVIQSIPSPKAEPFKRWLAQVGYERIKEIEDPELASARARELYQAKGYPQDWIEKRMRSIHVRGALTAEWKQRGVNEGLEYAILTAEIARATFGVTPADHRKLKGLQKAKAANLRDHMTDLELIFTMLGEASTTEIVTRKNARGFEQNKTAAKAGGAVAGNARRDLEAKSGKAVVSRANHLALDEHDSSAIALTAFIETQTDALAPAGADKTKTRKRVVARTGKTIQELGGVPLGAGKKKGGK